MDDARFAWFLYSDKAGDPTDPFTILKLQNPSDDVLELNKNRRSLDHEALNL